MTLATSKLWPRSPGGGGGLARRRNVCLTGYPGGSVCVLTDVCVPMIFVVNVFRHRMSAHGWGDARPTPSHPGGAIPISPPLGGAGGVGKLLEPLLAHRLATGEVERRGGQDPDGCKRCPGINTEVEVRQPLRRTHRGAGTGVHLQQKCNAEPLG